MSVKNLLDPILEQGIKNTNFFEGRLLAGEDLRNQHNANRQHDRYLGQAIGQGIINGLEVALDDGHDGSDGLSPVVSVKKGLAINALGEIIGLPENDIKLALSRSIETPKIKIADFYACAGAPNKQHIPNGVGIYILVMSPVAGYKEQALKSGLGDGGVAKGCGIKYIQEGVQFRLVELIPENLQHISAGTSQLLKDDLLSQNKPAQKTEYMRLSMLRNLLAHICFGTEKISQATFDPFNNKTAKNSTSAYGALSELYELQEINDCDVPLALFYWTLDGIAYMDIWPVRRRLLDVTDNSGELSSQIDLQIIDAMIMQFQEQMNDLAKQTINSLALSQTNVNRLFRYLPPSGSVVVSGSGSATGFIVNKFFVGYLSGTPTIVSHYQAQGLEDEALRHRPIDITQTDIIQMYWVQENLNAITAGISNQRYLFFTSRELHSFQETDNTQKTLQQTWQSYHNILRKNVLLPLMTSNIALPVRMMLQTDIQAINQYALLQSTAAAGRLLNREAVFSVFSQLYDLQILLAEDLPTTFEGDPNRPPRQEFSSNLFRMLNDTDTGDGVKGLKPSIENNSYQDLLKAQQKINSFVSSWAGEFIAGVIEVQHISSPDGDILVHGETFVYVVELFARTDSRAEVFLSAVVVKADSGTWGGAIEIHDAVTNALKDSVFMNPRQVKLIHIVVKAPVDLNPNEKVEIEVTATLPPPTDRSWKDSLKLNTGDVAGDPLNWALTLQVISPIVDDPVITSPNPGQTLLFIFDSSFGGDASVQSVNVTMTVTFEFLNSSRADWDISIFGHPNSETAPNSGVLQYTFPLTSSVPPLIERTRLPIVAPASRLADAQQCSFSITLQANIIDPVTLQTVIISETLDEPFVLILEGNI